MLFRSSGEELSLPLSATVDILRELGAHKGPRQLLVGFAAESQAHYQEGERKLREKNLDLIVVNDVLDRQSGFAVDTNQVTLIGRNGRQEMPLLSKEDTADRIWDAVRALLDAQDAVAD